jgi:lipopolysaccharide biosynthesis glycosyltransferase
VSDGTHSDRSRDLIRRVDPSVEVASTSDWVPEGLPAELTDYFTGHPTGKQLGLIMCLPHNGPALYIDSDVLFFAGAQRLAAFPSSAVPALYLVDCQLAADERLFRSSTEKLRPVNTGVLFLTRKLDWSLCIERLLELKAEPTFFTNQTATHLVMHANAAQPLEENNFVLQLDDQFIFRDLYAGPDIALRHYVNPVRHKFWTSLCRSLVTKPLT